MWKRRCIYLFCCKRLPAYLLLPVLLLQACSTTKIGLLAPSDPREEFVKTHASIAIKRVDDLDVTVNLFTEDKKRFVTLPPRAEKETWLPAGKQTIYLLEGGTTWQDGEHLKVNLDLQSGHHYTVQVGVGVSRMQQKDTNVTVNGEQEDQPGADMKMLSDALNIVARVGLVLGVVVFSVATGGTGSIAIPPLEFFRGKDEEEKQDT